MGRTIRRERPEPRRGARLPEPAPGVRRAIANQWWLIVEMHEEDDDDDLVLLTCPIAKIPSVRRRMAPNGSIGIMPAKITELADQIERAIARSRGDLSTCRAFLYTSSVIRADRSPTIERRLRDDLNVVAEFLTEKHWPKKIRRALGLPPA